MVKVMTNRREFLAGFAAFAAMRSLPADAAMRAKAAEVKALLGFPLYAEADNDAILVSVRSYGSGDVVFAVNDKRVMVPFGVMSANGKLVVSGILRDGAWKRPLPPEVFEVVNYATGERHLVRPVTLANK